MSRKDAKGHTLHAYRARDEEDLISLFNRVHEGLIGFVPRTLEYWRWCVLSRPDMSEEGVVVATHSGQIVGYAAVEKSGDILEFCHDSSYGTRTLVSDLLDWCVNYAQEQGANSVSLNAPVQDSVIRQACNEAGFTEEPFPSLFLRVLDLKAILSHNVGQLTDEKKSLDEAILINLRNFPLWCAQHLAILARCGEIVVSTEKLTQPTIEIDVDISTISSCIFGSKKTLYRAVLDRRLTVRPLRKLFKALKVLSWLQLQKGAWYVPKADFG